MKLLSGILMALGLFAVAVIALGLSGVLDEEPSQVESTHSVSVEHHHFPRSSWVNIWTIDGHWFIENRDSFIHHPGCPTESTP